MQVIIDRFEQDYAIVEIEENKTIKAPKILFPNAKEGDVIIIEIDKTKTEERKQKIKDLMENLFTE